MTSSTRVLVKIFPPTTPPNWISLRQLQKLPKALQGNCKTKSLARNIVTTLKGRYVLIKLVFVHPWISVKKLVKLTDLLTQELLLFEHGLRVRSSKLIYNGKSKKTILCTKIKTFFVLSWVTVKKMPKLTDFYSSFLLLVLHNSR